MNRCPTCFAYTLGQACPTCGGKAVNPHPAKFSPLDPYGKYRRMMKKEAEAATPVDAEVQHQLDKKEN